MNKLEAIGYIQSKEELRQRQNESKLLYYRPCCSVHKVYRDGKFSHNDCQSNPCPDSRHALFHKSPKRVKLVLGGNRSSKSTLGRNEILMRACLTRHPYTGELNPTGGRYRIYCPDFSLIEKNIIPSIIEWIPKESLYGEGKTKLEKFEHSYDKKYHILKLKDNRLIDFMSYDQELSKSESVELDGAWLDEEAPEEIYTAVEARCISRRGKIWITVTPLYGFTWGMNLLDSTDQNVEIFKYGIKDNPYNSDEAIADFEASLKDRPHERDARIDGTFLELQGLVYKELRRDIHLIAEGKAEGPIVFCMDPHPRKASVMTWSFIRGKDVIFFDELEMKGTASQIASAIRAKEASHPQPPMLRLIDPAAKAQGSDLAFQTDTLQEFEREGLSFRLADNSEAGYNVVHEYFTYDVAKPLSSFNRPTCFVMKNCVKTWYGLTHLMWDEWTLRRQLRDDKERIKDYLKDFPDCVRYTLAYRPSMRNLMQNPRGVMIGNMQNFQNFNRQESLRWNIAN